MPEAPPDVPLALLTNPGRTHSVILMPGHQSRMNLTALLLFTLAIGSSMLAAEEAQPSFARVGIKPHPIKVVKPDIFPAASFVLRTDKRGAVTDAGLSSSTGFGALDSLLLQSVRCARFKPVVRWGFGVPSRCSMKWLPDTVGPWGPAPAVAALSPKAEQQMTLLRRRPKLVYLPMVEHNLGQAVVEALVESSGVVVQARILKSTGNPRLDSAAVQSTLAWTFARWKVEPPSTEKPEIPFWRDEGPSSARMWVSIPLRFRLIYHRESAAIVHGKPPSE
jgi:TonB family protein